MEFRNNILEHYEFKPFINNYTTIEYTYGDTTISFSYFAGVEPKFTVVKFSDPLIRCYYLSLYENDSRYNISVRTESLEECALAVESYKFESLDLSYNKGVIKYHDLNLPIEEFPVGIRSIVITLLSIIYLGSINRDGARVVLSIENPESSLDPNTQIAFIDELMKLSRVRNVDIVVTTDGVYMVNELNLILGMGDFEFDYDKLSVYGIFNDSKDLRIKNGVGINASCFSEPLDEIYDEVSAEFSETLRIIDELIKNNVNEKGNWIDK